MGQGFETHFAHLSYRRDKGKVERYIQNLNREFVIYLRKFSGWLKGKLHEYKEWFNYSRFHRRRTDSPQNCTGVTLETGRDIFFNLTHVIRLREL